MNDFRTRCALRESFAEHFGRLLITYENIYKPHESLSVNGFGEKNLNPILHVWWIRDYSSPLARFLSGARERGFLAFRGFSKKPTFSCSSKELNHSGFFSMGWGDV